MGITAKYYTADNIPNTPSGNISATTVQAALNELDTEKVNVANQLAAGTDLNTVTTSGFYVIGSTATNSPSDAALGSLVVCYTASYLSQTIVQVNGDTYSRHGIVGGAWTAWAKVYSTENTLGTVSLSSGIPTGALMQYGSTSNGEYWRFTNGLQICNKILTCSYATNASAGNIFASGGEETWNFPAAFATNSPTLLGSVIAGVAYSWVGLGSAGSGDTTSTTFRVYTPLTSATAPTVTLTSIGSWN